LLTALPHEAEAHLRAVHLDVVGAQGGEPEGAVVAAVGVVADPDERPVEQADRQRDDLLDRQPGPAEVRVDPGAQVGQRATEVAEAVELRLVTHLAPARVVAVLLAAPVVAPGCLEVAVAVPTDPHVGPRGWDRERADLLDAAPARSGPVGKGVREAPPAPAPSDAGLRVGDVAQPCALCRLGGLGILRCALHGAGGVPPPPPGDTSTAAGPQRRPAVCSASAFLPFDFPAAGGRTIRDAPEKRVAVVGRCATGTRGTGYRSRKARWPAESAITTSSASSGSGRCGSGFGTRCPSWDSATTLHPVRLRTSASANECPARRTGIGVRNISRPSARTSASLSPSVFHSAVAPIDA